MAATTKLTQTLEISGTAQIPMSPYSSAPPDHFALRAHLESRHNSLNPTSVLRRSATTRQSSTCLTRSTRPRLPMRFWERVAYGAVPELEEVHGLQPMRSAQNSTAL